MHVIILVACVIGLVKIFESGRFSTFLFMLVVWVLVYTYSYSTEHTSQNHDPQNHIFSQNTTVFWKDFKSTIV
jgi:hypothetical protein